ncbi:MAG TPA: NIPSNAP family protein [Polyangia bacterium]|nr:NIPSNAP family protein [Polyangia bacterium]
MTQQKRGVKTRGWMVGGVALISFIGGGLLVGQSAPIQLARAGSNRMYELRIYHAARGKLSAMESRFRDTTSKLLAKHHLNVVGYWTGEDSPGSNDTFIFLLAHRNLEEAKKNWDAMRTDPEFEKVMKSEQAEKTLEKADVIYMRPTDFSPMK